MCIIKCFAAVLIKPPNWSTCEILANLKKNYKNSWAFLLVTVESITTCETYHCQDIDHPYHLTLSLVLDLMLPVDSILVCCSVWSPPLIPGVLSPCWKLFSWHKRQATPGPPEKRDIHQKKNTSAKALRNEELMVFPRILFLLSGAYIHTGSDETGNIKLVLFYHIQI